MSQTKDSNSDWLHKALLRAEDGIHDNFERRFGNKNYENEIHDELLELGQTVLNKIEAIRQKLLDELIEKVPRGFTKAEIAAADSITSEQMRAANEVWKDHRQIIQQVLNSEESDE